MSAYARAATDNGRPHASGGVLALVVLTIVLLAAGVIGLGLLLTVFRTQVNDAMAGLAGQYVDRSGPGYAPPDLKTAVRRADASQARRDGDAQVERQDGRAGAGLRLVVTVDNIGSGVLAPTVTLMVPAALGPVTVQAAEGWDCAKQLIPSPVGGMLYTLTCQGGLVRQGSPATFEIDGQAPLDQREHLVVATADMRFGLQDPNEADNTGTLVVRAADR